ncbi:FMN-binding protein [Fundicoccus culcitae]|uniref:FMN-binding protein n=1 Tax=Fundicoccus culcitae TaxID=2969821 RepID=A0ABY5P5C7_9LACT|nr:FMN-binding protein [Fundicoccus culcitae]UUX33947.1 FMN-binding protein [Fundicoccus culcitae]
MEMKKLLTRGSLLLGSMLVLAACGDTQTQTESVEEATSSVVESVEEEVSVEVESVEVIEESEEASEESEETTEESEETSEESEEASEESEEASEESEETTEESEETTEESEEASEESEEAIEESEEATEESEEATEESEEATEESVSATPEALVLQDGEYTLESDADEHGWSSRFTLVVADGEITEVNYDMEDADGNLKTEDEEYNQMMEDVSGTAFADAVEELTAQLLETQNPDEVDVVSGATDTSEDFKEYAQLLVDAAVEGNEETIMVSANAELQDGEYSLVTDADEHGWAHHFTIVVADGEITEVNYDMEDAEGNLKTEDEEYNQMMEDVSGTAFADAVEELTAQLLETQNPDEVDVVSGATDTSESFKKYAQLLIEAAIEGNEETIEISLADEETEEASDESDESAESEEESTESE